MADLDLLVLGDCNPDLILTGDVEPAFGQVEKIIDRASLGIGGSGAIVACGAARLGLTTGFIGVVGDDLFGDFMLGALADRGIEVGGCLRSTEPTGVSVILASEQDRAILTAIGSIGSLRGVDVDRDRLRSARHVHVSSYFLQRNLQRDLAGIFTESHDAGGSTSLDPNWDPAGQWDGHLSQVLECTDIFLPNEAEARHIAKSPSVEGAAAKLAEGTSVVAVKEGAKGAIARSGSRLVTAPAVEIQEMTDSTGAGDSFDAGFIAGHLLDWSLDQCLALACSCGSLSTRRIGGVDGQPTMEEAARTVGLTQ
jgi:sugar/nucleoside kinase (ribokinase family)